MLHPVRILYLGFDMLTNDILDDPAAKYITTRAVDPDVNSEKTYDQIRRWLAKCKNGHRDCPKPQKRLLPTRVVDVGPRDGSQDPRIYISKGEQDHYLVLSYCWGGPQPITLTQDTLHRKTQGIAISSLPRSLQDAVTITRNLGLQYIWIDALCIIQDSPEDKEKELRKMAQIYKDGLLTVSAASAQTVHDGFLQQRKTPTTKSPLFIIPYFSLDPTSEAGNITVQESHLYDARSEPVNKRGWTLQERLLSPRILLYGTSQLVWQCQTEQLSNGGVDRNFYYPGTERLNAAFFADKASPSLKPMSAWDLASSWIDIVIDYTHRSLSFEDDKLEAIAGIASEFQRLQNGDRYLAGMWRSCLIMELMWMVDASKEIRALRPRPGKYRAPSWSWAAIDGPTAFSGSWEGWPEKTANYADILRCETVLASSEAPTGRVIDGFLEVLGQIKQARWVVGTDDLFDTDEKIPDPIGKAYIDADEDEGNRVWCLRLQNSYGIMLRPKTPSEFQRVGYFEIRDEPDWSNTKWFDNCE
jgi:hypothetical protein